MTTYYDKLQLKLSEMQTDKMIPPKPLNYEELDAEDPAKMSYNDAMNKYAEALEVLKQKIYEQEKIGTSDEDVPSEEASEESSEEASEETAE